MDWRIGDWGDGGWGMGVLGEEWRLERRQLKKFAG